MSPIRLPSTAATSLATMGWLDESLEPTPPTAAALERLAEGPEPAEAVTRLLDLLENVERFRTGGLTDPDLPEALVAVASSRALTGIVRAHPEAVERGIASLIDPPTEPPSDVAALRAGVATTIAAIAIADLTDRIDMPAVGEELADLADWAAQGALRLASAEHDDPAIGVIAMGKWGGRELNYASDIDVVFVHADSTSPNQARKVADRFMRILSDPHPAGPPLRVDADLRPEGANGPLSRTLASYVAYWERWAEPWERQAMLKARPVAGDQALGAQFAEAAQAFAFPDTLPTGAISDIRAMKSRSERAARTETEATEIKRGVGGIRDAEFAVQLMQLVHGLDDPILRRANTLSVLAHLGDAGYISPDDASTLSLAYQWLRDVEHHLQLYDLRQTHEVPADHRARERLARSIGYRTTTQMSALEAFDADLIARRREVRTVHERLFYRPLLEAFGEQSTLRLDESDIARQLDALGFGDVAAARAAFDDLTTGLSRRSRLMQQYLPLMLDWISQSPDPDLGLHQLRQLVTSRPDNAPLIAALRDNPVAAERLCTLLGTSRLLGRYIDRLPGFLSRLGDDAQLAAFPEPEELLAEARRRVALKEDSDAAVATLGRLVTGYVLWIAAADLVGQLGVVRAGRQLSDLADAAMAAALDIAMADVEGAEGFAVVAMGKWGGQEMTYASDLDALFVYGDSDSTDAAQKVAERLVAIFDEIGRLGPALRLDLELRPEGRKGALVRSLSAYAAYYERWAEVWEHQALLRARPVAGDPTTLHEFQALAARSGPFSPAQLREIVRIKARVERERIRPAEDPRFHTKFGPGAMADVEWTAQYLTMANIESVQSSPSTLETLDRLADAGHLGLGEANRLSEAYRYSAAVRNRLYLLTGRAVDAIPPDGEAVSRLGRAMGYTSDPRRTLLETYRRMTRRARRVVDRRFYGSTSAVDSP